MNNIKLYSIGKIGEGTLYIMPCPNKKKLNETLTFLKSRGIDSVISLLETDEAFRLGVSDEEKLCKALNLEFENYPIKDFGIIRSNQTRFYNWINALHEEISSGKNIVIHCYAGIGRTGLVAGSIMIRGTIPAKDAIERMSEARGRNMPQTQEQYEFLLDFEQLSDIKTHSPKQKKARRKSWLNWLFE